MDDPPPSVIDPNDDFYTGGRYTLEDENGNPILPTPVRSPPTSPMSPYTGNFRLKLEGQKITPFTGNMDEWPRWKTRTLCAFSGTGYEQVLEDHLFAVTHPALNKVVYSQLLLATVEGTAYHLVHKHEDDSNGHGAWESLKEWYDGDAVKYETVEQLRHRLETLRLHPGGDASDYINKFLKLRKELERIPEERMTDKHSLYIFLRNITDPAYDTTIKLIRQQGVRANLNDAVNLIRQEERDLHQRRAERRRVRVQSRRVQSNRKRDTPDSDTSEDEGRQPKYKIRRMGGSQSETTRPDPERITTWEGIVSPNRHGYLSIDRKLWQRLEEPDRTFIRAWNSRVAHGEGTNDLNPPNNITIQTKGRRVQFHGVDPDQLEGHTSRTISSKKITMNLDSATKYEDCEPDAETS